MPITSFLAICLIALLYLALRLLSRKPDRYYDRLVNRTGKRLAKQLIADTKKNYPRRSRLWIVKKVLNDLDKGKI